MVGKSNRGVIKKKKYVCFLNFLFFIRIVPFPISLGDMIQTNEEVFRLGDGWKLY